MAADTHQTVLGHAGRSRRPGRACFQFLYPAKTHRSQFSDEGMSDRLADGYGFSKRPAGRGAVSFLLVGRPNAQVPYCGQANYRGANTPEHGATWLYPCLVLDESQ